MMQRKMYLYCRRLLMVPMVLLGCTSVVHAQRDCAVGFDSARYVRMVDSLAGRRDMEFIIRVALRSDTFVFACHFDRLYGLLYRQTRAAYRGRGEDSVRAIRSIPTTIARAIVLDSVIRIDSTYELNYTLAGGSPLYSPDSIVSVSDSTIASRIDANCHYNYEGLSRQEAFSIGYALTRRRFILIPNYDKVNVRGMPNREP